MPSVAQMKGVQLASLQTGDSPNSWPEKVIRWVLLLAIAMYGPVGGQYWPALGRKRTGAYPHRTAVRHTDAAWSMLHGWST